MRDPKTELERVNRYEAVVRELGEREHHKKPRMKPLNRGLELENAVTLAAKHLLVALDKSGRYWSNEVMKEEKGGKRTKD